MVLVAEIIQAGAQESLLDEASMWEAHWMIARERRRPLSARRPHRDPLLRPGVAIAAHEVAPPGGRYTRGVRLRPLDLVDVFAYLVVLGIFIQLFPAVITETFVLALLTAILLKLILEGVLWVKKKIVTRFRAADTVAARVISAITLLLVLPASKFLVLGMVNLVFGDAVSLGGFFQVTALIIALMLARGGIRRLFDQSDEAQSAA